jgi:6-phosphogluconate dehydrogenase
MPTTQGTGTGTGPIVGPEEVFRGNKKQFIDDLEQALYASKIISYTQGFMLMRETARALSWHLEYASIARIWRGGCIIWSWSVVEVSWITPR